MDVHGNWSKNGDNEKEDKARPARQEDPALQDPSLEDALASATSRICADGKGRQNQTCASLNLFASILIDSRDSHSKVPTSRAWRHITLGQLADATFSPKKEDGSFHGLSEIHAMFSPSQRQRPLLKP